MSMIENEFKKQEKLLEELSIKLSKNQQVIDETNALLDKKIKQNKIMSNCFFVLMAVLGFIVGLFIW